MRFGLLLAVAAALSAEPRVLVIGDSISAGYTPLVKEILAGKAVVERIETNGGDSKRVLENLESWLSKGPYDLVTLNCGLHDLKHTTDFQVPPKLYRANMEQIAARLKAHRQKWLWVTTTPVDDARHAMRKAGFERLQKDVEAYNRISTPLMKKRKVPICDLHVLVEKEGRTKLLGKDGVHYTPEGYRLLAARVAEAILGQLR
ncbi:MAG: SGNH/GDSL hydrolase family protein [Bryobacteraceae bacterium]